MRSMMLLFGVLIAFALAWAFDVGGLRRAWPLPASFLSLPSMPALPSLQTAPAAEPAHAARWRKCVSPTRTVYTDEACPAGFAEQAVAAPAVTVLPAAPRPAPAAAPASAAAAGPTSDTLERQVDQALRR